MVLFRQHNVDFRDRSARDFCLAYFKSRISTGARDFSVIFSFTLTVIIVLHALVMVPFYSLRLNSQNSLRQSAVRLVIGYQVSRGIVFVCLVRSNWR